MAHSALGLLSAPPPALLLAMDPLPPYSTSPAVGGEPAIGGEPVVAGQPAGDAPAVGATSFYPQAERAPDSTPHQGVGGEPAVGGEPPVGPMAVNPVVGVIIPPWDPEYSKNDVAGFRKYPEWWDLMSWVKENLQVNPRQALSTYNLCVPSTESNWAQQVELEDMWFGDIVTSRWRTACTASRWRREHVSAN